MKETDFLLRVKSGGWSHHPGAHDPAYRLLNFTLVASRGEKPLGGNNVQAKLRAPDQPPELRHPNVDDMWLRSGWSVSFRNQFAQAPDVATEILRSVEAQLAELTAELTTARGARTEELTRELFATEFLARGRHYWR